MELDSLSIFKALQMIDHSNLPYVYNLIEDYNWIDLVCHCSKFTLEDLSFKVYPIFSRDLTMHLRMWIGKLCLRIL